MRLALLYSGGKDSNYALYKASFENTISCLITLDSKNDYSYMFQKPGNDWIALQAECLELPLIRYTTQGEKEEELEDLKGALFEAKQKYNVEGIVTGAIKSAYQAARVQKICYELNLYCFNPLWQFDENQFLEELIENNFEIAIIGIASWPLSREDLGVNLNKDTRNRLLNLHNHYSLSPIGEGGEFETFVLDMPLFKKKIVLTQTSSHMDGEHSGVLNIEKAEVVEK